MSEMYDNLEEATAALANTAQRAANLIRTESARAKEEAVRARREIDDIRKEMRSAKAEFEDMKVALEHQNDDRDRIRRSASWAWSSVGAMAAILIVAVGWTCIQLTRGHEAANHLNSRISDLQGVLEKRESALAALQTQLDATRTAEARAKAQLEDFMNAYEPFPFENPVPAADLFAPAGPEPIWASISQNEGESEISTAE